MPPTVGPDVAVLIVDDQALVAEALAIALADDPRLSMAGVASSLADCMAMLITRRVDVVLLESRLPDGGSWRQTSQILQAHPGVKVVLLSIGGEQAGRVAAARAGCAGYASKRQSIAQLVSIICDAHRGVSRLVGAPVAPRASQLTSRELEVLQLLGYGRSSLEICAALGIGSHTLRNHVSNLLGKLHVHSKLEAVSIALSQGLIARPGGEDTPSSGSIRAR